jgi:hypothetical protein
MGDRKERRHEEERVWDLIYERLATAGGTIDTVRGWLDAIKYWTPEMMERAKISFENQHIRHVLRRRRVQKGETRTIRNVVVELAGDEQGIEHRFKRDRDCRETDQLYLLGYHDRRRHQADLRVQEFLKLAQERGGPKTAATLIRKARSLFAALKTARRRPIRRRRPDEGVA